MSTEKPIWVKGEILSAEKLNQTEQYISENEDYIAQEWTNGDIVTLEKYNHLMDGLYEEGDAITASDLNDRLNIIKEPTEDSGTIK